MNRIFVDNRPYEVERGLSLLEACLSVGVRVPYFCWHPALRSIGSCRLCAVKVFRGEGDGRGWIAMSCMTDARDGARISVDDPEVLGFRRNVIEWLMLNHPHDCPVCDEGGECHLQDMTALVGNATRRNRFPKRTHRNQELGPLVAHEMNRCIQCYRCVRFYQDYLGGGDLGVFGAHDNLYFGRHEDGPLESPFSGNLVEVCPTGVFTDKPFRGRHVRKWDIETAPGVCNHCSLGCNVITGAREGRFRRVLNRYNPEVNGHFICDRGRFGQGYVSGPGVLTAPRLRDGAGRLMPVAGGEALLEVGRRIYPGARVMGIGSPRATLEANYALMALVGRERFYSGMSGVDAALASAALGAYEGSGCAPATLADARGADAALVLGDDPWGTAPMLGLALRQAALNKPMEDELKKAGIPGWHAYAIKWHLRGMRGPIYTATTGGSTLDADALGSIRGTPHELTALALAVAHELDPGVPRPKGLPRAHGALAREMAQALGGARRPLIVTGAGARSAGLIEASGVLAGALRRANPGAGLIVTLPECNSMGVALMDQRGMDEAARAARGFDTLIVLENDLFDRMPRAGGFLAGFKCVIAIDSIGTPTTEAASIVLASAPLPASDGTYVSYEGRAQRTIRSMQPTGAAMDAWRWMAGIMRGVKHPLGDDATSVDVMLGALAREMPVFEPALGAAPGPGHRIAGMRVPRASHRASGRTSMNADVSVHEPAPPMDGDSPLAFTMEGAHMDIPPALTPRYWAPGWNSVHALDPYQAGAAGVRLDLPPGRAASGCGAGPESEGHDKAEGLLIMPVYEPLGGGELSAHADELRQATPSPYVRMNPRDMKDRGLEAGRQAMIIIRGYSFDARIRLDEGLSGGTACVYFGPVAPGWMDGDERGEVRGA